VTIEDVVELVVSDDSEAAWEGEYGTAVGGSPEKGSGEIMLVRAGSIGKVFDVDAVTGWVSVHFPLSGGPMTPHWVECIVTEQQLRRRSDLRDPFGPGV